jgi:hypothetical protein
MTKQKVLLLPSLPLCPERKEERKCTAPRATQGKARQEEGLSS